jgi:hypothetical protein
LNPLLSSNQKECGIRNVKTIKKQYKQFACDILASLRQQKSFAAELKDDRHLRLF